MTHSRPLILATRGSPLALAQTHSILERLRQAFPARGFEVSIIRTTGDKLQTAALARPGETLPKGLFTKELEISILGGEADLAVHSLKDLPTDLPPGLELGAVSERADPRDVLLCRAPDGAAAAEPAAAGPAADPLERLPARATVATSSTRRRDQLLARRPDLRVVEIRGNVGTRLQKLATQKELHATILAAAGLARLGYRIDAAGGLKGPPQQQVPPGLQALFLAPEIMLPCVGQAAIGLEVRVNDPVAADLCRRLDHGPTHDCVRAERAFLHAMGGGCQSPVAAYAELAGGQLWLRAVSFRTGTALRAELRGRVEAAERLGLEAARLLRP